MIKFQYITSDTDSGLSNPLLIDYYSTFEVKKEEKYVSTCRVNLCNMWRKLTLGILKENNCLLSQLKRLIKIFNDILLQCRCYILF